MQHTLSLSNIPFLLRIQFAYILLQLCNVESDNMVPSKNVISDNECFDVAFGVDMISKNIISYPGVFRRLCTVATI